MNKIIKRVVIALILVGLLAISKSSYDNAMQECIKYNEKSVCERGLR